MSCFLQIEKLGSKSFYSFLDNNFIPSTSKDITSREREIYERLCEIILTIHKSNEHVSRERVQWELFNYFRVRSWNELKASPSRFEALMNLTKSQKDITFYMNIFEQTFNLCTLYDLESLLIRFLKQQKYVVEKYEDLRLGPLEKNPEVRRIFNYQPTNPDQPTPRITTADVLKKFISFQQSHRYQRLNPEEFLNNLVSTYKLLSREELGIYCKSFPYLIQVI